VTPFKEVSRDIRGLTVANACAVGRCNPSLAEYHAHKRTTVMQIEASKKLFNVDDYYRMAEVGILGPEDHVELIDGEIIQMSPIGTRHAGCVTRINRLFNSAFRDRAVVSIQNPLRLNNYTEPEPDVVLLKYRNDDYSNKRMLPDDALLVVEVADTTLNYDRTVKLPRYAAAGVPEVWIMDLKTNRLLVHRDPKKSEFQTNLILKSGESVFVGAFPDTTFAIDELLG
jgi:Uma2 family endonuclease